MQINIVKGTGYNSAPASIITALNAVVAFYDQMFTNNITVNVTFNWQDLGYPSSNSFPLAQNNLLSSSAPVVSASTSAVISALQANETNNIQSAAYSHLSAGIANTIQVQPGDAELLGLTSGSTVDIYVTLNSNSNVNWTSGSATYFDPFGAIAHEITEAAMGRIGLLGSAPSLMDMFRYSAKGVRDLTSGTATSNSTAYFSIDGGATSLGVWNNVPKVEDYGDWSSSPLNNDAYGNQGGGVAPVSEIDLELMNILGWNTRVVVSGENLSVGYGHSSSGLSVMSGGTLTVSSGGSVVNTTYTDAQGFNDGVLMSATPNSGVAFGYIASAGADTSATVDYGGVQWVEYGGHGYDAVVWRGGSIIDYGATSEDVIEAGGREDIEGFGVAFQNSALSGGAIVVHTSGLTQATNIASGGVELDYGSAFADFIQAFGSQTVETGGSDRVAFISGDQFDYGVATSDTVAGVDAYQYVESGGVAIASDLYDQGLQDVLSGGVASGAVISGEGFQYVESGGLSKNSVINALGADIVYGFGQAQDAIVDSAGALYVQGTAIGDVVSSGGQETISAGGNSYFETISGQGSQTILAGGSDDFSTILGNQFDAGSAANEVVTGEDAYQYVWSGGVASDDTVSDQGYVFVSSGGADIDVVLSSGGFQFVESGGVADGATVGSGGVDTLYAGGVESGAVVLSSGIQAVLGVENAATVSSGGQLTIGSGGVASGTLIVAVATETVSAGGTEEAGVIGGTQYDAGLVAGDTVTGVNAFQYILSGGVGDGDTISGSVFVSSGGLDENGLVGDGGFVSILDGGVGSGTTIGEGGFVDVESGGSETGAVIQANGAEYVDPSGTDSGLTVLSGGLIYGPGSETGLATVYSGGQLSGLTFLSGGVDQAYDGAQEGDVTIDSGATLELVDGTVTGGVVSALQVQVPTAVNGVSLLSGASLTLGDWSASDGGVIVVLSGGWTGATDVGSGGTVYVSSAGEADNDLIESGGTEVVSLGGLADAAEVGAGGGLTILSGGQAISATVLSGGVESVASGGVDSGAGVQSGGDELLSPGGVLDGTIVSSGGTLTLAGVIVGKGAVLSASQETVTTALSGATLLSGAILDFAGVTVRTGGTEVADAGGVISGSTLNTGAKAVAGAGGLLRSTTVGKGATETASSGGQTLGATVAAGGIEYALSGGVVSAALVRGEVLVSSGGLATGDIVAAGGKQIILKGGQAGPAVLSSGGVETVSSGGVVSGATILAGATLTGPGTAVGAIRDAGKIVGVVLAGAVTVSSGGLVSGDAVVGGGVVSVLSAGKAQGLTVSSGGGLTLSAGAVVAGGIVLAGGVVTIDGAYPGAQTVTFSGAGELVLNDAKAFAGKIAGFNLASQKIDLGGFTYGGATESVAWSEAATNTSGTLTVTDGAQVAKLTLLGVYVTSNFVLSNDGHGGTLVVDPPPNPRLAGFVHAIAALSVGAELSNEGSGRMSSGGGGLANVVTPSMGMSGHGVA